MNMEDDIEYIKRHINTPFMLYFDLQFFHSLSATSLIPKKIMKLYIYLVVDS